MNDLFLALMLVSITVLVVGVIKPRIILRWDNEMLSKFGYRKTVGLIFGFLAFMFFVSFGITAEPQRPLEQTQVHQPAFEQPQKETAAEQEQQSIEKPIAKPPGETKEVETQTQTVAYLAGEGDVALFIYGITPRELAIKQQTAIEKGDTDAFLATEQYLLETPQNTKVLLLNEEVSVTSELTGLPTTSFFVKIKILDGPHKDKAGWTNRSEISLIKN